MYCNEVCHAKHHVKIDAFVRDFMQNFEDEDGDGSGESEDTRSGTSDSDEFQSLTSDTEGH